MDSWPITLFSSKICLQSSSSNSLLHSESLELFDQLIKSMVVALFLNPSFVLAPPCSTRFTSQRTVSKLESLSEYNAKNPSSRVIQATRRCELFDLHKEIIPYKEAWEWQKSIVKKRRGLIDLDEDWSDTVIILQHSPVYTLGTGSSEEYLNFDRKNAPYEIYQTERGGEVTYHGPGQLVMYPIINLRYHEMDLHWYLRALEEVVIRVLSSTFSIKASRIEGFTGVWVGNQKLAAIGVRVSRWLTYHGLALNVTTDLSPFKQIVPCGIRDRQVGSIKGLLEELRPSDEFGEETIRTDSSQLVDLTYKSLLREFSEVFQVSLHHNPISSMDLSH